MAEEDDDQLAAAIALSLALSLESQAPQAMTESKFTDTDGDEVQLKLENGKVNEYVNGELAIEGVNTFEINLESRTYTDDTGSGRFKPDEDLVLLVRKRDMIFKASLEAPAPWASTTETEADDEQLGAGIVASLEAPAPRGAASATTAEEDDDQLAAAIALSLGSPAPQALSDAADEAYSVAAATVAMEGNRVDNDCHGSVATLRFQRFPVSTIPVLGVYYGFKF